MLDLAEYRNGLPMQKYRPLKEEIGLPVLKIRELRQGFCDISSELCSPSIQPDYLIQNGDVIFSWSGSLLIDFWCGEVCGLNQHLFKIIPRIYDPWFSYCWTAYHLRHFTAIAVSKATTIGHIKREDLKKARVLLPSPKDYLQAGGIIKPMYELIIANRLENRRFVQLKDDLLSKLLNFK